MYRIRLATGHETVFETLEDIARGVSTGTITPECSVFHGKAGKWLPITVHPLYKQALAAAEEMASRPARPRRISRPLPRVDTPSPERTGAARPRADGPDSETGGAPPPAEDTFSPAAHELSDAGDADDRAGSSGTAGSPLDADSPLLGEPEAEGSPRLNDGLLDLGPIGLAQVQLNDELIIEQGTPPPDYEPPPLLVTPKVEGRTDQERARRPGPPAEPDRPEPVPAAQPELPNKRQEGADYAADTPAMAGSSAPGAPADAEPFKGDDGPLPIGALGDFGVESHVEATLPPAPRGSERRNSGALRAVPQEPEARVHPVGPRSPRPQRPVRDPFARLSGPTAATRAPLVAAAVLVGILVVGWVAKAFVFGNGTDPAEAATLRDTTMTLGAATPERPAAPPADRPLAPPSSTAGDSAMVAAVVDSLRSRTPSDPIRVGVGAGGADSAVTAYVAAYTQARVQLHRTLSRVSVPVLFSPERWETAAGALESQQEVRAIRAALSSFRDREAQLESTRTEGERSLRETTPQVRRADMMLAAMDSLFGWLASQSGRYVLVEGAIIFRGDPNQQAVYDEFKRRVLDEVNRPGAAPPSIGPVLRAIESSLFPTASSIPGAPSLPAFPLPADSSR